MLRKPIILFSLGVLTFVSLSYLFGILFASRTTIEVPLGFNSVRTSRIREYPQGLPHEDEKLKVVVAQIESPNGTDNVVFTTPKSWEVSIEKGFSDDEFVLVKNGSYALTFSESGMGSTSCYLPTDKLPIPTPFYGYIKYQSYSEIQTVSGLLLTRGTGKDDRVENGLVREWVCYKKTKTSADITYTYPTKPETAKLKEMDTILESLIQFTEK